MELIKCNPTIASFIGFFLFIYGFQAYADSCFLSLFQTLLHQRKRKPNNSMDFNTAMKDLLC